MEGTMHSDLTFITNEEGNTLEINNIINILGV